MSPLCRMTRFPVKSVLSGSLLFSLILGTPSSLFSLDPQKSIAQYGHNFWLRQSGLPANGVNAILQTHDGYLWLGTAAGLFRFDGVSFTSIAIDSAGETTHETVSALAEDQDGSLWIGTAFSGLRRIRKGKIFRYGLKEGFFDTQILDLFESHDGHLMVATAIGEYMFSGEKFLPVLLSPNYTVDIAEDSHSKFWICTHQGVRIIGENDFSRPVSITTKEGLPNDVTTCVYADRNDNIWIGTVDGLARYHDGKIAVYKTRDGLSDNHITYIYEDSDGNIWVGTNKGGIDRFKGDIWQRYTKTNGLTDNQVLSISEDRERSLWVCTADGLNQFRDVSLTTYTTYDGLGNDYVSTVIETPDRSLYFLSDQGSNVTQMKNGKVSTFDLFIGPAYVAHDGSLWIGQSGMLNKIKNGRITRYNVTMGMQPHWVSAITEDDKSLLMYIDHMGIFRLIDGKLKPYLIGGGHEFPSKDYIVCFYPQRKDLMWVGMADSLVKIENGTVTGYTTANGLAGNWVSSIYDDHQGSLWISSPQGGLTRYFNGRLTAYNTKAGLFTDEIYCALGDDKGGLWLSSPSGIGQVQRQELNDFAEGRTKQIHSRVFTTADGMKTDECFGSWQPAGWKMHNGDLWFATKRGAVLIQPKKFEQNSLPPPVYIEQVVVDQKNLPTELAASLQPDADKLEFHYTALSYLAPGRVRFKYMLEGYDKVWVDAETRRVAYYTSLAPNHYRFRVMACNNDGVWNEAGASFAFELQPHFYETYWFYGLVVIALGAAGFGVYQIRLVQLVQRKKELETKIQEAMANIKVLGGLIPICSNCKKIRNDKGYWDLLEGYIQQHSEAKFSHGICPDCAKLLYPKVFPSDKETS
ncbi:MAG TPA: two-component regulator propeller domain-containing protein [Bacteroidota bacterium]|nr:two-component regulator propeller domain-containing protein [Bacteroidota bacterium]